MTKKILKLGAIILGLMALTVAVVVIATPKEESNTEKTLGQLVDEMDGLRDLKEECANNLNIADSAKFLKGYTGYCDSWDGEIIELRGIINEKQKKDYEGLVGLM